jgi:Uma2 family endonuclease
MSSVAQRLITAEEFWQSPENSKHSELVRGEVIETMPPGKEHGTIALKVGALLLQWAEQGAGGKSGVEAGFILARDPATVRGPDAYYISPERAEADDKSYAFWTVPPDLAVEVVSPSESAADIRAKVRDFLAAGTRLVWVVFPDTQEVIAHTPDGLARTYSGDDILEHPDVLPGFSCKVAELFM